MGSDAKRRTVPRLALIAGAAASLAGCGPRWNTHGAAPSTSAPSTATTTAPPTTTTGATGATAASATTDVAPATISPATSATQVDASTTTVDLDAAKAAITANWTTFFDPATSIPDRLALLENGPSLQAALEQRATDPLMRQAAATVKSVDLTSPTTATVTYDVLLNGTVALPDAQGNAVLEDGVWKVTAASFCSLISLGATAPIPGCS